MVCKTAIVAATGSWDARGQLQLTMRMYFVKSNKLGSLTIDGDSPVDELQRQRRDVPEYRGTRETLWESGRTTS